MQITLNGRDHQTTEHATVAELLGQLQLSGKPVAVEVNRELIPQRRHAEQRLAEGDLVEVVTLVGGG